MATILVIDPVPILVIEQAPPAKCMAARFWARMDAIIERNYDDAWCAWASTLPAWVVYRDW